jgi:hypothetical protein
MKTNLSMPKPGQYRDGMGRLMSKERATPRAARELSPEATRTSRFAGAITSHEFVSGDAGWDGMIDDKAMKRLVQLGVADGLIKTDRQGTPTNINAFKKELRPFQLEFVKDGADAMRKLQRSVGDQKEFFEVADKWPAGASWSVGEANDILAKLIKRDEK